MKKRHQLPLALLLTLLSACGSGKDLADLADDLEAAVKPTANPAEAELAAAIPKILKGLEDIKQEIKALEIRAVPGTAPKPGATPKPGTPTPKPTAGTKPAPGASAAPSAAPAGPSAAEKGKAELMKVMDKIIKAPYVVLTTEKHEKNLTTGKVSYNKVKMSSRQPNLVKIDILKSSSGSEGVSALYNSGQGNIIKVKKFFVKLDLPKDDDRVTSNNAYRADDIDLFGVSKRFSNGYDAELVGTSQLNGTTINVLKLSTTGTNTLDSRIAYEYLGYEPETYAIRLWEAYDKSGAKDPYYRMVLNEISYPASVPDSVFTL